MNYPNIGQDPLSHRGEGYMAANTTEAAMKRLGQARDIQQTEVPDQTALVWRIDISRVLCDLVWLRARYKRDQEKEETEPPTFKLHLLPDRCTFCFSETSLTDIPVLNIKICPVCLHQVDALLTKAASQPKEVIRA